MRRRREQPKPVKSKFLVQTCACALLIITVMCVKTADKGGTNPFIKNLRTGLNTSVDFSKTAESLKKAYEKIMKKGENLNDGDKKAEEPVPADTDLQ